MLRSALFIYLIALFFQAEGQVYPSCPIQNQALEAYENPLYEKWLSVYDVKFYDLKLSVSNTNTIITGTASILIEAVSNIDTLVLELQDALEVSKIGISDNIFNPVFEDLSDYQHTGHAIYIHLDRTRGMGDQFLILIEYEGEAGQDRGFFAGITTAKDPSYGFDVTYTLSEPHNAKDWFPVKQVLEDKIDSVRISLQCDDHLMAASNGLLEEIVPGDKHTHTFRWRTRYPMAYYLLSFAVANYRDFSFKTALSDEGDSVLVQNFIYDSDDFFSEWEDEIRATGSMIKVFSDLLIDYPFVKEKYGHAMAPMGGGMEHQTMTTIHDFSFFLVAHELAHQWFGDYITCGNWQDIWINEGFASYMEYVAAQEILGQGAADGWMENAMSIALGETDGSVYVPMEEVEDNYRLFDYGLSYKKGAILLHMIRYRLNDDVLFFEVFQHYLEQFGLDNALGEDFRGILESVTGMDFSCFFDQWYYGEGFPRFNVTWFQQGDSLKIRSEQVSSAPHVTPLFRTPFDIGIIYSDGTQKRMRMHQNQPVEEFALSVEDLVTEVHFDPDSWILKTASVIHQIPADRKFVFGPNPVTDELMVHFSNQSHIDEVLITTMSGQKVLRYLDAENPVKLNLSILADGAYLLVMHDSDHTYLERIVKVSSN